MLTEFFSEIILIIILRNLMSLRFKDAEDSVRRLSSLSNLFSTSLKVSSSASTSKKALCFQGVERVMNWRFSILPFSDAQYPLIFYNNSHLR